MDTIVCFIAGCLWAAASIETEGSLRHELAPARVDLCSRWYRLAGDLGWKWAPRYDTTRKRWPS